MREPVDVVFADPPREGLSPARPKGAPQDPAEEPLPRLVRPGDVRARPRRAPSALPGRARSRSSTSFPGRTTSRRSPPSKGGREALLVAAGAGTGRPGGARLRGRASSSRSPSPSRLALALGAAPRRRLRRRGRRGLRGDRRLAAAGPLLLVLLAGFVRARGPLVVDRETARRTAAEAGEGDVFEVRGRLSTYWTRSGSLWSTRLDVVEARRDGVSVALPGRVVVSVAGETDPAPVAGFGDLVRVRGPLRLPDPGRASVEPVRPRPRAARSRRRARARSRSSTGLEARSASSRASTARRARASPRTSRGRPPAERRAAALAVGAPPRRDGGADARDRLGVPRRRRRARPRDLGPPRRPPRARPDGGAPPPAARAFAIRDTILLVATLAFAALHGGPCAGPSRGAHDRALPRGPSPRTADLPGARHGPLGARPPRGSTRRTSSTSASS